MILQQERPPSTVVILDVRIPDDTPPHDDVFIAGDFNAWNPAHPQYRLEHVEGNLLRLALPVDFEEAEFKFTRGSWDSAECGEGGGERANRTLSVADADAEIECEVKGWCDRAENKAALPRHTITGDVRRIEAYYSPQLNNFRDILVYRPPAYTKDPLARFPVIYMQDGQNLFDEVTAYSTEWGIDEISERLAAEENLQHIVVAINHMGRDRLHEYAPWPDEPSGAKGWGERYTRFVTQTLKPAIDAAYRTKPEREHTAIIGSSLGGLISLYAGITRRDIFGFVGALSPSVHLGGGKLLKLAAMYSGKENRFYLDYGESEFGGDKARSHAAAAQVEEIAGILQRRGGQIRYQLDPDGEHNELSWSRRVVDVLRWFHE